jgi:hypothetical protein
MLLDDSKDIFVRVPDSVSTLDPFRPGESKAAGRWLRHGYRGKEFQMKLRVFELLAHLRQKLSEASYAFWRRIAGSTGQQIVLIRIPPALNLSRVEYYIDLPASSL